MSEGWPSHCRFTVPALFAGRPVAVALPSMGFGGCFKEIVFMGLFPVFFGAGRFGPGAASRRRSARAAFSLLCALFLGAAGSALPVPGDHQALAKGPDSLADLADSVSDAVVNISATQTMDEKHASNVPQMEPGTPFDDLFEEFFRRHQQGGNDRPDRK